VFVALAQEVPMSYRGRDAVRRIDHRTLFASCTKWLGTLEEGSRAEESLDRATRAAMSGRLGTGVLVLLKGMLAVPVRAAATRAHGITVSARTEVGEELDRAVGSSRTVVLDVITDPSAYPAVTGWGSVQHVHKALPVAG
jgi:thiamine pyrophosphate-dependent acetolactate synthase large subunit-like protein